MSNQGYPDRSAETPFLEASLTVRTERQRGVFLCAPRPLTADPAAEEAHRG